MKANKNWLPSPRTQALLNEPSKDSIGTGIIPMTLNGLTTEPRLSPIHYRSVTFGINELCFLEKFFKSPVFFICPKQSDTAMLASYFVYGPSLKVGNASSTYFWCFPHGHGGSNE